MNANYTGTADVLAFIKEMKSNSRLNNRDIENIRWNARLDNYEPGREYGSGFAVKYSNDHVSDAYVLFHDEQFGDSRSQLFLIDDGEMVKPYYLASWNESGGFFILHPFKSIGVSFGPRKTYHIHVQKETWV